MTFKNGGFADKIRQIADKVGQYAYNIGGQIRQNGIVGKIERRKPPLSARCLSMGLKKLTKFITKFILLLCQKF